MRESILGHWRRRRVGERYASHGRYEKEVQVVVAKGDPQVSFPSSPCRPQVRYAQLQPPSIQASPRTTWTSRGRALINKPPTRRRSRGLPIRSDICWRVPSALARDRRPTQDHHAPSTETTRAVSHRRANESTRPTQHIPTRTSAANILRTRQPSTESRRPTPPISSALSVLPWTSVQYHYISPSRKVSDLFHFKSLRERAGPDSEIPAVPAASCSGYPRKRGERTGNPCSMDRGGLGGEEMVGCMQGKPDRGMRLMTRGQGGVPGTSVVRAILAVWAYRGDGRGQEMGPMDCSNLPNPAWNKSARSRADNASLPQRNRRREMWAAAGDSFQRPSIPSAPTAWDRYMARQAEMRIRGLGGMRPMAPSGFGADRCDARYRDLPARRCRLCSGMAGRLEDIDDVGG